MLHRLDEIVERQPSKIFIMIGINDLEKGIPQKTTIDNIKDIVATLQEALSNGEIYLESVLPTTTLALEKIENLNQEIEIVAEQNDDVFYVDIYSLFLTEDSTIKSEVLSADGVHLNGEGYRLWIEEIRKYVE